MVWKNARVTLFRTIFSCAMKKLLSGIFFGQLHPALGNVGRVGPVVRHLSRRLCLLWSHVCCVGFSFRTAGRRLGGFSDAVVGDIKLYFRDPKIGRRITKFFSTFHLNFTGKWYRH